ncbi:hypothetical protein [Chromobacterium sphagni]|uniref:Uncharacterized protein n=1 Tax=Chromobacterium sphagni TaxID=1903179 RepID=A0ABX3CEQ5_9NEIS|nr:hypothetical protein [Chromobacterium sphagni]OHX20794.1 hypothetical protein BI344_13770 [Chromobacterium sphagni]
MNQRYALVLIGALALPAFRAGAANQPEDTTAALGWNTLQIHSSQTLAGAAPNQYSAKNLFDPDPAKAWVFHAEERYPRSSEIKNPAVLTLTLAQPSSLFAIALTPGYLKSAATQFQNASPKSVLVSLYRPHEDKPFETRRFSLAYHAREYSFPQLQKELKTVAFNDPSEDRITGKSDNALNTSERLLLLNASGAKVAKITLEIPSIEAGAKYTDTAISKLRLLDRQASRNSPEYGLSQYIAHNLDAAAHSLSENQYCLSYTDKNAWPRLQNHPCAGPAPKLQQGQADQGIDDIIFTRKDPATQEYQVPLTTALRDAHSTRQNGMKRMRLAAADVANNELILSKNSRGELRALSGLTLTQAFLANRTDGLGKAYLQPQDSAYFFFAYSRLQFTPANSGYQLSVYGPTGSQEAQWAIR